MQIAEEVQQVFEEVALFQITCASSCGVHKAICKVFSLGAVMHTEPSCGWSQLMLPRSRCDETYQGSYSSYDKATSSYLSHQNSSFE